MNFPDWALYIIMVFGSYFIGSFPTGWILGKALKKIDIRNYGSGNTGFSNVYRVLGKWPAVISIICDIIVKGYLLAWILRILSAYLIIENRPVKFYTMGFEDVLPQAIIVLSGLMAVVGHNWPIWLKFKGGKGMATTAGIFICFVPITAAGLTIIWFLIVISTRYTSLSNIITTPTLPIFIFLETYFVMDLKLAWYPLTIGGLIAGLFILWSHRENIARLRAHKERKFGDKSERIIHPQSHENQKKENS